MMQTLKKNATEKSSSRPLGGALTNSLRWDSAFDVGRKRLQPNFKDYVPFSFTSPLYSLHVSACIKNKRRNQVVPPSAPPRGLECVSCVDFFWCIYICISNVVAVNVFVLAFCSTFLLLYNYFGFLYVDLNWHCSWSCNTYIVMEMFFVMPLFSTVLGATTSHHGWTKRNPTQLNSIFNGLLRGQISKRFPVDSLACISTFTQNLIWGLSKFSDLNLLRTFLLPGDEPFHFGCTQFIKNKSCII